MDIKKLRQEFEKLPDINAILHNSEFGFNEGINQYYHPNHAEHRLSYAFLMGAWSAWQAAKAQAVPEGFVLVKKVHPDAIVHNQGLGLFKECQVIYGWDGKSKDFKDALNKGFYHGVKLGAKAVLETAMIEAQEQKG